MVAEDPSRSRLFRSKTEEYQDVTTGEPDSILQADRFGNTVDHFWSIRGQ